MQSTVPTMEMIVSVLADIFQNSRPIWRVPYGIRDSITLPVVLVVIQEQFDNSFLICLNFKIFKTFKKVLRIPILARLWSWPSAGVWLKSPVVLSPLVVKVLKDAVHSVDSGKISATMIPVVTGEVHQLVLTVRNGVEKSYRFDLRSKQGFQTVGIIQVSNNLLLAVTTSFGQQTLFTKYLNLINAT